MKNKEQASYLFSQLMTTIEQLRHPEHGCPWDLAQTHETLLPYLVEESYEFIQEAHSLNYPNMREELGDVLLQILLHSQLASEKKEFSIADVIEKINDKMIKRHPHVFDNPERQKISKQEVENRYQEIKKSSKANDTSLKFKFNQNDLKYPSLIAAQKIGDKSAQINFDWKNLNQVKEKVEEEWKELVDEINIDPTSDKTAEELGDLLFTVVQLARHLNMNAEVILSKANKKFVDRFTRLEQLALQKNMNLQKITQDEMENLWQTIKGQLK